MTVGIQPGSIATSDYSKDVDAAVKQASRNIAKKYPEVPWVYGFTKDNIADAEKGMQPDGGIFLHPNPTGEATIPALMVEAKFQDVRGNAIERWFVYQSNLYVLNPNATFLTFCYGPGAADDKVIPNTLALVHGGKKNFNIIRPHDLTTFVSESGFSYTFIERIIEETLLKSL